MVNGKEKSKSAAAVAISTSNPKGESMSESEGGPFRTLPFPSLRVSGFQFQSHFPDGSLTIPWLPSRPFRRPPLTVLSKVTSFWALRGF
ncbi:hypothetical protein ACLKA7_003326 [Drosophila subpalustris]